MEMKLESRFAEHEEKLETRFTAHDDQWERKFPDLSIAQDACLSVLESAAASFDDWRPGIEGTVDSVRLEVGKLSKHWERSVMHRGAPILGTSFTAAGRPSATGEADKPRGHRVDSASRAGDFGSVTTVVHPPVKGTISSPDPIVDNMNAQFHHYSGHPTHSFDGDSNMVRLPKLNFPSFVGDNPKLWPSRTADFMDFYRVPPSLWVKLALMHIELPSSRWLPSVEHKLKSALGSSFLSYFWTDLVVSSMLVRQFLTIRHTGSLADYIDNFTKPC